LSDHHYPMANKEEINGLILGLGVARSTFKVGDQVLYDGEVTGGEYIVLCSVIEVTEDSVKVQEERTYYLNGGEFPGRKISMISRSYFQKPIWEHIHAGREVFEMIVDAFQAENEKQ